MIDNRAFLVLVIGLATLFAVAIDAVLDSFQNDRNNEIHDKVFVELHELYTITNSILEQEGGVDQHIINERHHFNQTIEVAEILGEYIKSVNNTDTSGNSNSSS